jgi:hypothetical protein
MKRGLAMLAALLLLLGLMSGCGGSGTSAATATASDMVATEEMSDNGTTAGTWRLRCRNRRRTGAGRTGSGTPR